MLRLLGVLENPGDAHSIINQVSFLFWVPFPLSAFELPFRFSLSVMTDIVGPSALALLFLLQLSSVFAFVAFSLLVKLIVRFSCVVLHLAGDVLLRLYAAAATVVSLISSLLWFVFFLLVVTLVLACLGRHCFLLSRNRRERDMWVNGFVVSSFPYCALLFVPVGSFAASSFGVGLVRSWSPLLVGVAFLLFLLLVSLGLFQL